LIEASTGIRPVVGSGIAKISIDVLVSRKFIN